VLTPRNGSGMPDFGGDSNDPSDGSVTRKVYAQFLAGFSWSHFCTFTAPPTAEARLIRSFSQTVRRLERVAQGPVRWFWVRERGSWGTPHLHVLLSGTDKVSCQRIRKEWRLGHCDVSPYDPSQGGVFYLTKDLFSEYSLWDVAPKLRGQDTRPSTTVAADDDLPPFPGLSEHGSAGDGGSISEMT
jgi:hypothetical protein